MARTVCLQLGRCFRPQKSRRSRAGYFRFKYSCIDTIEERIDQILEQKQELFDDLVDDVSIDLGASLSADQLFGLFGLERPV